MTTTGNGLESPPRTYFAHDAARQVADRVWWLASCSDTGTWGGKWRTEAQRRHVYTNAYLVVGDDKSLLVESGHSAVWPGLARQLAGVLGTRPLDYVLPTHHELPHCGNLGRLADRWPGITVVGDVTDYLLYFPELLADQLLPTPPGSVLDLGGVTIEILQPIWHDLPTTVWAWTPESRVLFCVDGMQFSHEHGSGDCGKTSGELDSLPGGALVEVPARDTIKWARYTDLSSQSEQFRVLVERLGPEVLAPTHGAPIAGNAPEMIELVLDAAERLGRELHGA